jgi:hypothetical protein
VGEKVTDGGTMANGGLTPEQAIAADEQTFRVHVIMALDQIGRNCKFRCDNEAKRARWLDSLGKMLLQSAITGIVAVGIALITLHFNRW